MNNVRISVLHIILLSMTFIGLKNHVTILPALLQSAARDAWIAVIIALLYILPWLLLLHYVHRTSKQHAIKDWMQQTIGTLPTRLVMYSVIVYCLIMAAFTMRETLLWVEATFLPRTPMLLILVIYAVLIIFLVTSNLHAITIVNVIVLFGVLVLGFFVAFVNIKIKNYELLRPFLEHGWAPVMYGSIFPASGFVELLLLLFLQHHVKGTFKFWHFVLMLFLLGGLTLGPLMAAIAEFGPTEAAKQHFPAYEEWAVATIGRFLEHMDFFSIYQWLTGAFIRIGILLYVASDLSGIAGQKKKIWLYLAPPFFVMCLILSLLNDGLFLMIKNKHFLIFTFIFFVCLAFILSFVALVSNRKAKKAVKVSHD